MTKISLFISLIFISLSLSSCQSDVRSSPAAEPQTTNNNSKEDDRGFDPCLINANLPVCSKK